MLTGSCLDLNYIPQVLVNTGEMEESKWLEWRRKGIGGSDVAAVFGVSPFTTGKDLYLDKIGTPVPRKEENWIAMEAGKALEDLIARVFAVRMNARLMEAQKMFQHPLFPFMLADIDRLAVLPDGTLVIVECKNGNPDFRYLWEPDTLPYYYELQVRHYLCVLNMQRAYIVCMFRPRDGDVIHRRIDRDLEMEAEIIEREKFFWEEYVQKCKEPPYIEGAKAVESFRRRYAKVDSSASPVILDNKFRPTIEEIQKLQLRESEFKQKAQQTKEEIQKLIVPILEEIKEAPGAYLNAGGKKFQIRFEESVSERILKPDLIRLQELYPDIYNEFVSRKSARKFQLKGE